MLLIVSSITLSPSYEGRHMLNFKSFIISTKRFAFFYAAKFFKKINIFNKRINANFGTQNPINWGFWVNLIHYSLPPSLSLQLPDTKDSDNPSPSILPQRHPACKRMKEPGPVRSFYIALVTLK